MRNLSQSQDWSGIYILISADMENSLQLCDLDVIFKFVV